MCENGTQLSMLDFMWALWTCSECDGLILQKCNVKFIMEYQTHTGEMREDIWEFW